jgi:hypothetical protein
VPEQTPALQVKDAMLLPLQITPQPPQLFGSSVTLKQKPPQQSSPVLQTLPQPPQLLTSVWKLAVLTQPWLQGE